VLEQLGRVTPVTGKSMFGGAGIYTHGLFFALIAEDRLYFKVNDAMRPEFERRGMEPFPPFGKDSAMGYYEVPDGCGGGCWATAAIWMRKAIDVATAAKSGKSKRTEAGRLRGGGGPVALPRRSPAPASSPRSIKVY
jgi:DNA transformation protein